MNKLMGMQVGHAYSGFMNETNSLCVNQSRFRGYIVELKQPDYYI